MYKVTEFVNTSEKAHSQIKEAITRLEKNWLLVDAYTLGVVDLVIIEATDSVQQYFEYYKNGELKGSLTNCDEEIIYTLDEVLAIALYKLLLV